MVENSKNFQVQDSSFKDICENCGAELHGENICSQCGLKVKNKHFKKEKKKENNNSNSSYGPLTFNEVLGTFRIKLTRLYIPLLICIISATFLSWLTYYQAKVQINVAPFPDESNVGEIILNGIIPVLISALFIVIIYFIVKKFGLIVFKIIMGVLVLFYCWYGFTFFVYIFYLIYYESMIAINEQFFVILFYVLYYGSAIVYLIIGIFFFKNKLSVNQKNMLVLSYGIFIGAIIGVSLPLWSIFSMAIFFSIYDLIIVFKGPLGKIWDLFQENQQKASKDIKNKVESGEISEEEADELSKKHFIQNHEQSEEEDEDLMKFIKDLKLEIGSGDLIFYSAIVAATFITTNNWLTTLLVIVGVLLGAGLTIYYLLKKKRVLPALPFSMAFGIVMFFIGQLIQYLITIGVFK